MSASTEVLGTYQCTVRKKSDTNFCRLTCVSRPGFFVDLVAENSFFVVMISPHNYVERLQDDACNQCCLLCSFPSQLRDKKLLIWSKDVSSIRFPGFALSATCSHISPKCTPYKVRSS